MRNRTRLIGALAIAALVYGGLSPRQGWAQTTLRGGVSQTEYTDEYAKTCEQQNQNNPYVGMNPFECHGEMAPTDSAGQCSLNIGPVWKKVDNTCYYCSPINPPIQGMILPLDQVHVAESQGWGCGANQTDACTAICYGGSTFSPPPGTVVVGGGPGLPPTPPPKQGGPPPGYAPMPGPAGGIGYTPGANPCLPKGPGGYDYCQNGPGARLPAGCVCSRSQPAPSQPSNNAAANQLAADAQTILQNAGRISKQMTDSMDVTKHNNVGIGVALGAYFGAAVKMMGIVAQEYQALAAAGRAVSQESSVLQMAGDAASESGAMADQAAQAASSGGGAVMGAAPDAAGYLEGVVLEPAAAQPAISQGVLPTCAVLSCDRVAQLLGKNIPLMRIIEKIKPRITLNANGTASGGLTAQQVAAGLKSVGINAQVGSGMTNMMNQVRAGNPVVAGMYTNVASGTAPLHAVVIEGVEARAGVTGLKIYDPVGMVYWQPIQTFQKYFTQQFVMPL